MKRGTFIVGLLLGISSACYAQDWEKLLIPGLSYRMEIDNQATTVTHAIRWTQGATGLSARAELANFKSYAGPKEAARQEMSQLLKKSGAIAAINGDFFGGSGEPLGVMVRDGELVSRPFPGRASFGWGPSGSSAAIPQWTSTLKLPSGTVVNLTGLNEDVPPTGGVVLFTDACAQAPCAKPNTRVILKTERVKLSPTGIFRATVVDVVSDEESRPILDGEAQIVVTGAQAEAFKAFKKGDRIALTSEMTGFDWSKVDNVIGGGPMLVRNGKSQVDWETASFSKSFAETKHPRTAIGRTATGDIWFVVVDGRQPMSVGISLADLSKYMISLGCVDAVNLDGGGSSTLSIFGEVLNRPSDGFERKVSNGVLFFGQVPAVTTEQIVIQGPANLKPSSFYNYRLIGSDGKPVPDRDVLWSAMGPGGWIDQGGLARTLASGNFKIRAYYQGEVATLDVAVIPDKPTPKP